VRGYDLGEAEVTVRTSHFVGFNMAAFRADLLRVGGFPEYLGPNPEFPVSACETICLERLLAREMWGVFIGAARVSYYVPAKNRTPGFALARARMTGKGRALAETFEDAAAAPPRVDAELGVAALSALRWAAAVIRLRPRAERFHRLYDLHRDLGRFQGAWRARRGAEACGHKRLIER